MPEKALKYAILKPKFKFFNIFQKFLQKFTSYVNFFISFVGVPGCPKTLFYYLTIISTKGCKKISLIKETKNILYWTPKSVMRGGKTRYFKFSFS